MLKFILAAMVLVGLYGCGDNGVSIPATDEVVAPSVSPPPPTVTPPVAQPVTPPVVIAKSFCDAYTGPTLNTLVTYEGAEHNHSEFSDGDPGYTPVDYYAAGKKYGLDFMIGSEHSEDLDDGSFVTLSDQCLTPGISALNCFNNPTADKLTKWTAIQRMADAAATPTYLTSRAFEYSPDRFGHINVLFSKNFSNYASDASYVGTMELFWQWFQRDPNTTGVGGTVSSPVPGGGGSDGIATFNHPGDKCNLNRNGNVDAGCNWNGFAYVAGADERMVGIEAFNTDGSRDRYYTYWIQALDIGWHLGAVAAEDLHHPLWGQPQLAKFVVMMPTLSLAEMKKAMLARRFYALGSAKSARITVLADGQHPMGARMACPTGSSVPYHAEVSLPSGAVFDGKLQLIGSGNKLLAEVTASSLDFILPPVAAAEHWYLLRVLDNKGNAIAYSSPVWLKGKV